MISLTASELLLVARRATGGQVEVRDHGLLQAAAARPQTTVTGQDAYPDLATEAAALLHSLTRNHPLVDGNERLALAGAIAFLGVNGQRLTLTSDQAYDLTMAVATGDLQDVSDIGKQVRRALSRTDSLARSSMIARTRPPDDGFANSFLGSAVEKDEEAAHRG